jgi:hypothetical protein
MTELQSTGLRSLTRRAWALLSNNWVLFALMMLETVLTLFILGGQAGGFNPLLVVLMVYLHLAILSGWFYQMKTVALQPEYRTGWGDFFGGVSLYAGRMLVGGGYLLLIFMAVFFASSVVANFVVTSPEPEVLSQLQAIATEGDNAKLWQYVQSQPLLQEQLLRAGAVFLVAVSLLALFLLSIFFWPYNVVLYDMRWREAWAYSRRLLRQTWRPFIPLALAWIGVHAFFVLSVLTGQVVLVTLSYIAYLLGKTLLPLMTLLFLVDYAPERLTPIEEES